MNDTCSSSRVLTPNVRRLYLHMFFDSYFIDNNPYMWAAAYSEMVRCSGMFLILSDEHFIYDSPPLYAKRQTRHARCIRAGNGQQTIKFLRDIGANWKIAIARYLYIGN